MIAPTNDAFADLPEGTVEDLLLPENIGTLTDILTYHVLAAEAPSSSLSDGDVETLNGATVAVTVSDTGVAVNDANVIIPDIMACNGIIHAIDAVLLPPVLSTKVRYDVVISTFSNVPMILVNLFASLSSGTKVPTVKPTDIVDTGGMANPTKAPTPKPTKVRVPIKYKCASCTVYFPSTQLLVASYIL